MDSLKSIVTTIMGLVVIYGMFFADYKVTSETDENFKVIWKEYSTGDTKNFIIKDELTFYDGINNSIAIFGKTIADYPMDGWNFYNTSNDFITLLKIPFWMKIILHIVLFFFCLVGAAFVMFISFFVLFYKLLFFEAALKYYLGFCLALGAILVISNLVDDDKKHKSKPKSRQGVA